MSKVTKALNKIARRRLQEQLERPVEEELESIRTLIQDDDLSKEALVTKIESFIKNYQYKSDQSSVEPISEQSDELQKLLSVKDLIIDDKESMIRDLKFFLSKRKADIELLANELELAKKKVIEKDALLINQDNLVKRLNKITSQYIQLEKKIQGPS